MTFWKFVIAAAVAAGLSGADSARAVEKPSAAAVDAAVKGMFKKLPEGWTLEKRVLLDETQSICSETRNNPTPEQASRIQAREAASIVFPADGNLIGNWKDGEKVAQNGRGGQFSDTPDTVSGGNCYACHQMAAKEVSYGTLGPSLLGYGKLRNFKPDEAKAAYAKIYNAQAANACSTMPRFGYHKVLSEQQMKDVLAYLFDPESPVNK